MSELQGKQQLLPRKGKKRLLLAIKKKRKLYLSIAIIVLKLNFFFVIFFSTCQAEAMLPKTFVGMYLETLLECDYTMFIK